MVAAIVCSLLLLAHDSVITHTWAVKTQLDAECILQSDKSSAPQVPHEPLAMEKHLSITRTLAVKTQPDAASMLHTHSQQESPPENQLVVEEGQSLGPCKQNAKLSIMNKACKFGFCYNDQCYMARTGTQGCKDNQDCEGGCDISSSGNVCVGCTLKEHCGEGKHCDEASGKCVDCTLDEHCGEGKHCHQSKKCRPIPLKLGDACKGDDCGENLRCWSGNCRSLTDGPCENHENCWGYQDNENSDAMCCHSTKKCVIVGTHVLERCPCDEFCPHKTSYCSRNDWCQAKKPQGFECASDEECKSTKGCNSPPRDPLIAIRSEKCSPKDGFNDDGPPWPACQCDD
mmetsp:Transcript_130862/g.238038  ORF Transcript_130862/g.238038 Transcript_130862/m.238038 type:complete len:343 (-) Transcript_130862:67-1095(-)